MFYRKEGKKQNDTRIPQSMYGDRGQEVASLSIRKSQSSSYMIFCHKEAYYVYALEIKSVQLLLTGGS